MEDNASTVRIEPIPGYNALRMTWHHEPASDDAKAAFQQIIDYLDKAEAKVNIVVDVQSDPQFPLGTTLSGAARPHTHPRMGRWLVIGQNRLAQLIGNAMNALSDEKILWFSTEEEALVHLQSIEQGA
jgi:hypothetical protein